MTSSTGTVVFNDAKLQAVDVVATERLGVGTLDPTSNLHVVGNVHVTGNVNKLNFTEGYTIKRGANVSVFGTTDVIQEITGPHARASPPLRKYPEVFIQGPATNAEAVDDNEFIYGGYKVTTSSTHPDNGRLGWRAFNGDHTSGWITASSSWNSSTDVYQGGRGLPGGYAGEWIKLELPQKIKVQRMFIEADLNVERRPLTGYLLGSNDDSSWSVIKQFSGGDAIPNQNTNNLEINSNTAYKYVAFLVETISGGDTLWIDEIEYYGYEETSDPDTSVDTTITSVYNLPDTTGMKLYLDGDKGSTPTDYSGEGHTLTNNSESFSGNAWSFTSLATSNVTMSTGDLAMEGTHPHSVSLWFNVANVSSNATLFHVGTAAGEGDAKTSISLTESGHLGWIDGGDNQFLSSNTWHNLVYATQGGGGLRTCYLDGRKLGDVSVQDTFGQYPPFAMTGYSQGGYTVSASSNLDGNGFKTWNVFDDTLYTTGWHTISPNDIFNGTNNAYNASSTLGGVTGAWLKLEMPHKLHLSYIEISNRSGVDQQDPEDFQILGSNDDVNWTQLINVTGAVWTGGITQTFSTTLSDTCYKYLALVVTRTNNDVNLVVCDLKYYGHKENDTTRFPVSSTVLKYPHIAMTGPAQRGYVVTTNNGTDVSNVFARGDSSTVWATASSTFSTSSPYGATSGDTITDSGSTQHTGHWMKLQLPRKISLTRFVTTQFLHSQYQLKTYVLLGSNDDTSWVLIHSEAAADMPGGTGGGTEDVTSFSEGSPSAYKYYMLLVKNLEGAGGLLKVGDTSFYGTEEDLDIVARVGEGLDGKVANFRVYDKYLHEEQALELWDAQKDQFGRATSSVVVHKGRLGIGTTEPKAALTVMDEVVESEEFPPRAMTGYETYMEGHGVFKVSASSEYITINEYLYAWKAFDYINTAGDSRWATGNTSAYNGSVPSQYTAGAFSTNGYLGEWIQLEVPYRIKIDYIKVHPGISLGREPESGYIFGSDDGMTWTLISNFTGKTYKAREWTDIYVGATTAYTHIRMVVSKVDNGTMVDIGQLRYFGTREQGASTLHNGELTLTRNLTVPRIGPALDADDTPRRDRLVVEYNTSTNPTENGVVKDTSGRGLDGRLINGAYYDASEKALVFDGTDDYLTPLTNLGISGDWVHSFSGWFKFDTFTTQNYLFTVKGPLTRNQTVTFRTETTGYIISAWYGNNITWGQLQTGVWYHICLTYPGSASANQKLYINGELQTITNLGSYSTQPLDITTIEDVRIGSFSGSTAHYLDGSVSNIKIYDVALTADEVKRLYQMGRCDEGHHVVNFSKTRVGIGLGDGEAPQGDMHVRGSMCVGPGTLPEDYWFQPALTIFETFSASGSARPGGGIQFCQYNSPGQGWMMGVDTDATSIDNGCELVWEYHNNGVRTGRGAQLSANPAITSINFTGQHRTFIKDVPFSQVSDLEGLIVSSDQNKYIKMSGGIEAGSNAITTNESLPIVSLSNVVTDKRCFGVISASENPEQRSDAFGGIKSFYPKEKGDIRVYINSVGEGAMWVTDINGPLESGDYITTSNVAGYGQKQDGAGLMNYTVAKITMDCDFEPATQPIQRIKQSNVIETHYTGMVSVTRGVPHEFVTTTVTADDEWSNVSVSPSDVTYAEWSNLEANVQNTYTLTYTQTSNVVYDVKYTKTTTANVTQSDPWDKVYIDPPNVSYAEWSNLEVNVQNTYTLTFTQTTTEDKSLEEWSVLESNTQSLYNVVYYQLVEQKVDADHPGAVKHETVTDRVENTLDEYGQLQWEDDPLGATEKAYRIRYLDASGQQTDEANCVHRAAFVGCTYHCG